MLVFMVMVYRCTARRTLADVRTERKRNFTKANKYHPFDRARSIEMRTAMGGDELLQRRRAGQSLGCNGLAVQLEPALRAADPVGAVEQELPADGALQAGAAKDRDQLLVEAAKQRAHILRHSHAHRERNTPITLPRMSTWAA